MQKTWKRNLLLIWKGWGYSIVIAVIIATSFKSAIADWNVVPTGSMKPTIVEGDRIFINKLAYDLKIPYTTWHIAQWRNPQRGDIVVFYSPKDHKRLVKRVIGLPGDTIAMYNDHLKINGRFLSYGAVDHQQQAVSTEDALQRICFKENLTGKPHPVMISPYRPALRSFGPTRVPEGKYFMMGDNRDNSADSRFFGFVDRDQVVGRALGIVISLDINHYYNPRWERFFTALQ
jgi:signal peptidase I